MHFGGWKVMYFVYNFMEFCFKDPFDNITALFHVMVLWATGDKSLIEKKYFDAIWRGIYPITYTIAEILTRHCSTHPSCPLSPKTSCTFMWQHKYDVDNLLIGSLRFIVQPNNYPQCSLFVFCLLLLGSGLTHCSLVQYIPRNMHTVTALLCFVVVIHWLIFPYPSGLLHWHCGNLTIAPVPAKQPWWIWINTSCEFIMNDCITTTKQSTTKPCAYFLGYTVHGAGDLGQANTGSANSLLPDVAKPLTTLMLTYH